VPWRTTQAAIAALALVVVAVTPEVRSAPVSEAIPAWTSLRFGAKNAFGRVGGEIALRSPEQGPDTWIANVRTWFHPVLFWDKGWERQVWFNPDDGAVARSTKLTTGPKPDKKIYRFTAAGAHRVRIEPLPSETELEPTHWSQVRESFYEYRVEEHGCTLLSDPAALFARVSRAAAAGAPQPEGTCIFLGKTLYRVAFRRAGLEQVEVNYRVWGGGKKRKGETQARRIEVYAWPVAGELDEEPMEVILLVEERSGLPLRIRTPVPGFGEMDIALEEVALF
jgi:hypothetical protein